MIHSCSCPVRFSDTDRMGHVNHARFLTYLEDARVGFFRSVYPEGFSGRGVIVAHVSIDYLQQLVYDPEPLSVELWTERIGGRSFTLGYRISQHGREAARAETVLVGYDYASGSTRPLDAREREALEAYQRDRPPL